jgi:PAS domain S-box-containing protein
MLQYTGREKWVTRRTLVLLSIVPLITLLLVFTNETHRLIWRDVWLTTDGPFALMRGAFGTGLWVYAVYAYLIQSIGVFLLIQALVRSRRLYRWQGSALLIAVLAPWVVNALSQIIGWRPVQHLDLTPFALGVTVPATAWGFYRLHRLDILPVARAAVFDGMSDGVMVLDAQNRIVDLNPAAQRLLGCAAASVIGQSLEQAWPAWPGSMAEAGADVNREVVVKQGESSRIYDVRISPLTDWRDRLLSRIVVLREITERVQAEGQIKASLREKEMLLKEIHHRVKNNLQIISSLLSLQSKFIKDAPTLEMLRDSQNRVRSMALVHERLYRSPDLARVDFAEYVRHLAMYLFRSYGSPATITLRINADDVWLGVDVAVPCGLIMNELVSNALKHAFPEGRTGEICIALTRANAETCRVPEDPSTGSAGPASGLVFTVSDNGIGLPAGLDFRHVESLGLQLVITLVEQLDGAIALDRSSGTAFRIVFPAPADHGTGGSSWNTPAS